MNDAIRLVKKELGKDAVILSTREKDTLAVDGGRALRVVEVVAAAASSVRAGDADAYAGQRLSAVIPPGPRANEARTVDFPRVQRQSDTAVVKGSPTLERLAPQTKQAFAENQRPTTSKPNDRTQDRLENRPTDRGVDAPSSDDVRDLRQELFRMRRELESLPQVNVGEQMQEIKVLLHDIMRARAKDGEGRLHEYLADIAVRLRAAGVRESIVTDTLQVVSGVEAPRVDDGQALSGSKLREFYLSQTIKVLFRQLGVTGHLRFDTSRPSMACLVGPTGVGKTTSIAKLAARLKLTESRKVTLVSMDAFRIGGADQLRVYAKILDCPFAEVSEPQELVEVVARQPAGQIVLVDTAGRNARHDAQMEGLRSLAGLDIPLAFHLVLAATMKQRDLDENIKAYRFLAPESLVFTKLDESWSYGEILNCSVGSRTPLSYFTTGQKVPEDLEPATKERVVERLFRL
ncbi:MAG: hypothetical protein IOD12_06245 [Silvanigrellales bacterium]|nr:hypothetical protein [Silvanigrellales bacterium]